MIRRTFLFLPTIGELTERSLWERGVETWDDFLGAGPIKGFSERRKGKLDEIIKEADRFLSHGNTQFFTGMLPSREHWRLFSRCRATTAYLDIETDGLSSDAVITVVGIHRAGRTETLVCGQDLTADNLRRELKDCQLLVTFNGSSFDVPILEKNFPFSMPRVPHFDLRHACARLGMRGGLKSIERHLGISRPHEVDYVTGEEAVYLWRIWERKGSENALKLLCRYNEEDTRNLEPLADYVYDRLEQKTVDGDPSG